MARAWENAARASVVKEAELLAKLHFRSRPQGNRQLGCIPTMLTSGDKWVWAVETGQISVLRIRGTTEATYLRRRRGG